LSKRIWIRRYLYTDKLNKTRDSRFAQFNFRWTSTRNHNIYFRN
jgi:hypothetical protein